MSEDTTVATLASLKILPANSAQTVTDYETFKDLLLQDYDASEESCELNDVSIDTEGYIVIGGVQYQLSPHGLKSFCRVMKIPFAFVTSIPAFIVQTIIDDMKLVDNRHLKYYVKQPEVGDNGPRTILNFVGGDKSRVEYLKDLLDFLDTVNKPTMDTFGPNGPSNTHYEFHNALVSDCGFQINYLVTERSGKDHVALGTGQVYKIGRSIIGDNYAIRNCLEFQSLLFNTVDSGISTIGKYEMRKHGLNTIFDNSTFKLNDKTMEGNEKKATLPFREAIKESWAGYSFSRVVDFESMIRNAFLHDISLWKFFDIRSKLAKSFDSIQKVDELIGTDSFEPTQQAPDKSTGGELSDDKEPPAQPSTFEILKTMKKEIKSVTAPSELDKVLKTTILKGMNAKVIYDSLVNYMRDVELSEFIAINSVAVSIIVDTFNHSTSV